MLLLLTLFAALMLAPGAYAAVKVKARHGWAWAIAAGLGVTFLGIALLLATVVSFAPLGLLLTAACVLAALKAYDDGRLTTATSWTAAAVVLAAITGWPR